MSWVDFTLMLMCATSVASNIPLLSDPRTIIPRSASVPKALACTIVVPCYFSLEVYWTCGVSFILCLCKWAVVIFKAPSR